MPEAYCLNVILCKQIMDKLEEQHTGCMMFLQFLHYLLAQIYNQAVKPQAHDCPLGQIQLCSRFTAILGATLKARSCAVQPNACVCFCTCFKHVLSVAACMTPCCGSQHTNQHLESPWFESHVSYTILICHASA